MLWSRVIRAPGSCNVGWGRAHNLLARLTIERSINAACHAELHCLVQASAPPLQAPCRRTAGTAVDNGGEACKVLEQSLTSR